MRLRRGLGRKGGGGREGGMGRLWIRDIDYVPEAKKNRYRNGATGAWHEKRCLLAFWPFERGNDTCGKISKAVCDLRRSA